MRLMNKDSRGFAFSVDLLLALIPLTILLGMAAADMDSMLYTMQTTVSQSATDRVATDTVNALLETSGEPLYWELTGTPTVPGIAYYDPNKGTPIKGTISWRKLNALTAEEVQNMVGNEYGFFMNVSKAGSNQSIKTLGTLNSTASNVVKIERLTLYSNLEVVSKAENVISGSGSIRPYNNPPNQFQTSYLYTQTYDYWILVDNHNYTSANITINNGTIYLDSSIINNPIKIDPNFLRTSTADQTKFFNNTVTVIAGSSQGNWMNLYILEVPKGTPAGEITLANVQPNPSKFQFYLWLK